MAHSSMPDFVHASAVVSEDVLRTWSTIPSLSFITSLLFHSVALVTHSLFSVAKFLLLSCTWFLRLHNSCELTVYRSACCGFTRLFSGSQRASLPLSCTWTCYISWRWARKPPFYAPGWSASRCPSRSPAHSSLWVPWLPTYPWSMAEGVPASSSPGRGTMLQSLMAATCSFWPVWVSTLPNNTQGGMPARCPPSLCWIAPKTDTWSGRWSQSPVPSTHGTPGPRFTSVSRCYLLCRRNLRFLARKSPRTCKQSTSPSLLATDTRFLAPQPSHSSDRPGWLSRRVSQVVDGTSDGPRWAMRPVSSACDLWAVATFHCWHSHSWARAQPQSSACAMCSQERHLRRTRHQKRAWYHYQASLLRGLAAREATSGHYLSKCP